MRCIAAALALALALALLCQTISAQTTAPVCCIDDPNKPTAPTTIANFNCSLATPLGETGCRTMLGGGVCAWATGSPCVAPNPTSCTRVSNVEIHYGVRVDVGKCMGPCRDASGAPTGTCKPKTRNTVAVGTGFVEVIVDCDCSNCAPQGIPVTVDIPVNTCSGKCPVTSGNSCFAGRADNFDTADGPELASPSALLQVPLTNCLAGLPSSFDSLIADRCFGHTFSGCIQKGPCPIKQALVRICLQGSSDPGTTSDSISFGAGGNFLWGTLISSLTSTQTWNPNQALCTTLDLGNLPGGVNILAKIQAAGDLDVVVRDDTGVDFVSLDVTYTDCLTCIPKYSVVSTLYAPSGPRDFTNAIDCACIDATSCHRESVLRTFYPGTKFETMIDIGACVGGCSGLQKCRATSSTKKEIQAPDSTRTFDVINTCGCA